MPRFRIKQLEIVNFRGFRGTHVIPLDKPIVTIYGPVGAGKSSIVQAVEYALFGQQLEIRERIAKLVDLINEEEHEARVRLTLESTEGTLQVARALRRAGDSAREISAELIFRGKKLASTPREVTSRVVEVLRLDEDDFTRFVLVTHRVLEGLVYGTSAKRSLTIDRLFGIDVVEELYKAIPIRKIEEILEEEKRKLAAFKEIPEVISRYGSLENARRILEQYRKEIEELRKLEDELTRRYMQLVENRKRALTAFRDLEKVYLEYLRVKSERERLEEELAERESDVSETSLQVELDLLRSFLVPKLEELALSKEAEELARLEITTENLEESALKIYNIVESLESMLSRLKEEQENLAKLIDDLRREIATLESQKTLLERRVRELEAIHREYLDLVRRYGSPEKIRRELSELNLKLEEKERQLELTLNVLKVYENIVRLGLKRCPICMRELSESDIENIKESIRDIEIKYSNILKEIENLKTRMAELEKILIKLESLRPLEEEYENNLMKLRTVREQYSQALSRLETAQKGVRVIEKRIQMLRFVIDEARSKIDQIEQKLEVLKKIKRYRELLLREKELEKLLRERGVNLEAVIDLEREISEIERKLEQVREKLNSLSIEYAELERVLSSIPVETVEELRKRVLALEDLYRKLNEIRGALKRVQVKMREKMLEKVRGLIGEYFRMIYPYPDLVGATIDVVTRERLGVTISEYMLYGIRRGGKKVPISRLSDGQRLTIALAFMISVYVIANHNVDFIIMDEPLPYVDVEVKKAFSNLITKLIEEKLVSQLIITSQSRDFIEMIIEEAKKTEIPTELIEVARRNGERELSIKYVT